SSRRRHTTFSRDWSSDVRSSDLSCRSSAPSSPPSSNREPPPVARSRAYQPLSDCSGSSVNGVPASNRAVVEPSEPPTISRQPPSPSTRNHERHPLRSEDRRYRKEEKLAECT